MAKKNDSGLVQDALIPDEMSPLSLLDFNSSCAKIKQAAVDFRRAVNHKMQLETKDAYLDKFHQIDPYTEAVYDTDALAQHIIDCAEVINRLLTYPKDARRAVLYDNLHDSLATFEESAPDYPDPDDDADETDRGEAVDPTTGEIKQPHIERGLYAAGKQKSHPQRGGSGKDVVDISAPTSHRLARRLWFLRPHTP